MLKVCTIYFVQLLLVQLAHAQWQLKANVIWANIDQAVQDNFGNFYLSNRNGDLAKFDSFGKLLVEYSPVQSGRISQIDAASQLKVWLFYQGVQEFVSVDRYMSSPTKYRFSDFPEVGYVSELAPNSQQNVWLVDMTEFTLNLIDVRRNSILEKKSLAKILDQNEVNILSLRSHQNRMYMVDQITGVHVFDNIGNYISKLNLPTLESLGFYKDYVYYLLDDQLMLQDLYSTEILSFKLPTKGVSKVLYSEERLIVFNHKGFEIYQYLSGNLQDEK